jgi:signal transduction histidine kinase
MLENGCKLRVPGGDASADFIATESLLANLCHELRTPLNAILGFAQLLASGLPSPTSAQERNIGLILEAGWYQEKLINEVLDLALVESGNLSLSLEPISLLELMRECQIVTESRAQTRGVSLRFPTIAAAHFVEADRIRVRQVLISLLSHAIDHGKIGGTLVVDCDARSPEYIRFCIRDGGGGLAADHLAQLFEPLIRMGKAATAGQGTGVGMVLTKRLVELMGGAMGVDGHIGTDRELWFELKRIVHPPNCGSPLPDSSFDKPGDVDESMDTLDVAFDSAEAPASDVIHEQMT